jgi:hypothetical protein
MVRQLTQAVVVAVKMTAMARLGCFVWHNTANVPKLLLVPYLMEPPPIPAIVNVVLRPAIPSQDCIVMFRQTKVLVNVVCQTILGLFEQAVAYVKMLMQQLCTILMVVAKPAQY